MAKGKKSQQDQSAAGAGASLVPAAPADLPKAAGVGEPRQDDSGAITQDAPDMGGQQLDAEQQHHLLYKGAGGQMAVMSEFLFRLINVAVPEVDVGDDIFVVKEKDEAVTRVQVKYSKADDQHPASYVTQFNLPWEQFDLPQDTPALVYVLAVRYRDHWTDFIVIRRSVLRQLHADHDLGTVSQNTAGEPTALKLRLVLSAADVTAKGGFSLQKYRDAFKPWPPPQVAEG